jgi:hypothetical protein
MVKHSTSINKFVRFIDTGGMLDHHYLFVCFVDTGGMFDHHCLFVCFFDTGGMFDHHYYKTNK